MPTIPLSPGFFSVFFQGLEIGINTNHQWQFMRKGVLLDIVYVPGCELLHLYTVMDLPLWREGPVRAPGL